MDSEIIQTIVAEISMAYLAANKTISETNMNAVAQSLQDALKFSSPSEVHEAFRRAKMVCDIPTQRTLAEALANARAESTPIASSAPAIDYRNPLETWLPTENIRRRINLVQAMKNYCAAVSDALYMEYCKAHAHYKDENGKWRFVNPDKADTFDTRIKDTLRNLYRMYWRKCACAAGYPAEAPYNLGLVPPTVPEFKAMLYYENQQQRA